MVDPIADALLVALGQTLLHSLWQGATLGLLTGVTLRGLRLDTAARRYGVACTGLGLIALAFVATAATTLSRPRPLPAASSIQVRATVESAGPGMRTTSTPARRPVAATLDASSLRIARVSPPEPTWWSAERLQLWSAVAVPVWLAGMLLLSTRLTVGMVLACRLRRSSRRPVSDALRRRIDAISQRLSMPLTFAIFESVHVSVPTVVGWLRPVILLPVSALTGLPLAQLDAVVAHELAHIRRHDYLVNLLQSIVEIVLFYHPAVWWLSRQIRIEREHCCDDVAAACCESPVLYASALAELEALRQAAPSSMALGLAATDGPLLRRVRRLLERPAPSAGSLAAAPLVAAGVVAVLLLLWGGEIRAAIGEPWPAQTDRPGMSSRSIPANRGIVSGQILDAATGQPIAGATVVLGINTLDDAPPQSGDRPRGPRVHQQTTDGEGRFEITDVAPADYTLEASGRGYIRARFGEINRSSMRGVTVRVVGGRATPDIDVRLQPSGFLSGRVLGDAGKGRKGVEMQLLGEVYLPGGRAPAAIAFAQTEDGGVYRFKDVPPGDYIVMAYTGPDVRPTTDPRQAFLPTYYPEGPAIGGAQPVTVAGGQERFDVDFTLAMAPLRRVAGRVVDPRGPGPQPTVTLTPSGSMGVGGGVGQRTTTPDATGRFEFADVEPGAFMLTVFDPRDPYSWFGSMRHLTVVDDITDVEIVAQQTALLSGRVSAARGRPLPAGVTEIRLTAQQRVEPRSSTWSGFGLGRDGIKGDGTFEMRVPPGLSSLSVGDLPRGWIVRAITLDGADITDTAVDFGSGGQRRLEITLTDRPAHVIGTVTDDKGRRLTSATVIVFPEEATLRQSERLRRRVFSHQAGGFEILDLAPGSYRAVALDLFPEAALQDLDMLDRLWPYTTAFRVAEGEQESVTLKLAPTPPDIVQP